MNLKAVKKVIVLASAMVMLGTGVFAVTLTDIGGHWAESNILELVEAGVINGYQDDTFRPQGTISKAEFIKLLIAASAPSWYDFSEGYNNPAHWALPYVDLAQTYNVIYPGELTVDNLNEPVTRKEMAIWMAKADVSMMFHPFATESVVSFSDCGEFSNEDLVWINQVVARGYINGYTDNTFKPEKNMTRAEAATVIYRYTR